MKNLRIGPRLAISYAVVLGLLIILILVSLMRMSGMNDATNRLVKTSMVNQRAVAEWAKIIEVNSTLAEMAYRTQDENVVKDIAARCKSRSRLDCATPSRRRSSKKSAPPAFLTWRRARS